MITILVTSLWIFGVLHILKGLFTQTLGWGMFLQYRLFDILSGVIMILAVLNIQNIIH